MSRADDHAVQELALRSVRKNIDKIQRKLFQIVVNHHQVAVLPLQFLFVRLDLHLALPWLLLIHCVSLPECRFELTTSACGSRRACSPSGPSAFVITIGSSLD